MEPKPDILDQPRAIRAGEELDIDRLTAFLQREIEGLSGPVSVRQFPSGHSNLTYLVRAGDRELVLRRPPFGSRVKSAHDMGREHRILSKLSAVYPLAPRPVAFCDDDGVLGAPFYLMNRIAGVIVRANVPDGVDFGPEAARGLSESLIDNLAALHAVDYEAAGLGELGKPDGYVERQVTGWTKRYAGSVTDEIPDVDRAAAWLAQRIPTSPPATILHNDYKIDNVVLDPSDVTRLIGVLDWEMSTLGDPLMDLGTALGYWIEAGDSDELRSLPVAGPTSAPGALTRTEMAERYAQKTGRDVSNLLFYYVFALFKTAVVLQQIYYRYKQGLTKDPRFGALIFGVRILASAAVTTIDRGRI